MICTAVREVFALPRGGGCHGELAICEIAGKFFALPLALEHFRKCEDNLGDSEGSAREGKMTCDLHALHAAPADAVSWLPPALSGYRNPLKKRALKGERSRSRDESRHRL